MDLDNNLMLRLSYLLARWHRIIEQFRLESACKGHLVQPPCSEQGPLQLNQVALSPVQPGLECCQGWASTTSLGDLAECFTTRIVACIVHSHAGFYKYHCNNPSKTDGSFCFVLFSFQSKNPKQQDKGSKIH